MLYGKVDDELDELPHENFRHVEGNKNNSHKHFGTIAHSTTACFWAFKLQFEGSQVVITSGCLQGAVDQTCGPNLRSAEAYDLTKFAKVHPGGAKLITDAAGMDATAIFDPIHPKETSKWIKAWWKQWKTSGW